MNTQPGPLLGEGQTSAWRGGRAHAVGIQNLERTAIERLLRRIVRTGALAVVLPDGATIVAGDRATRPKVRVRIEDWPTVRRLALTPDPALGEAYMDGRLVLERGSLWDFLDLMGRNLAARPQPPRGPISTLKSRLQTSNGRAAARRNVAHHYDLSLDLYRRFLDEDLQYSCAYFERPQMSLEEAQAAKKRHIADKLLLRPGQRVLDIGCGWGGLAMTLAEEVGVEVVGITLSQEQLAVAKARAQSRGLQDRVEFRLQDYRDVGGHFDRIVSVGMFEHVGVANYQAYFDAIARLLSEDGVALVHAIGHRDVAGDPPAWIRKYIFPGGYIAALSEALPAIERTGLWVTDIEILRLHYAETLKAWRERFTARREEIAAIYDERFCRMWEFYLAISEVGFRHRGCMVFQIQMTKQVATAPITRDYMFAR